MQEVMNDIVDRLFLCSFSCGGIITNQRNNGQTSLIIFIIKIRVPHIRSVYKLFLDIVD